MTRLSTCRIRHCRLARTFATSNFFSRTRAADWPPHRGRAIVDFQKVQLKTPSNNLNKRASHFVGKFKPRGFKKSKGPNANKKSSLSSFSPCCCLLDEQQAAGQPSASAAASSSQQFSCAPSAALHRLCELVSFVEGTAETGGGFVPVHWRTVWRGVNLVVSPQHRAFFFGRGASCFGWVLVALVE